jgi:xylulokinase
VRNAAWPKDYLRFRLTGVRCTDVTEAGGAALLNWETLTWATDRLASCGIDPALLPPLLHAQEDAGRCWRRWRRVTASPPTSR